MTLASFAPRSPGPQIHAPVRQETPLNLRLGQGQTLQEFHYEPIKVAAGEKEHLFALHYFPGTRAWRISHLESGLGLFPLQASQFGVPVDVNRPGLAAESLCSFAKKQLENAIAEHGVAQFNAALAEPKVDPASIPPTPPTKESADHLPARAAPPRPPAAVQRAAPAPAPRRAPVHREDMSKALREGRLFYYADEVFPGDEDDPDLRDYPFVVFKEAPTAAWSVSDAWHTNAKGEASEQYPLPVRMASVRPIAEAPDELRAPFQDLLPARQVDPEAFGGFCNLATMEAARCLTNDSKMWEELARDAAVPAQGCPTGSVFRAAVRRTRLNREIMRIDDREQINWDEVASQFDAESSPCPRALPEPRRASVPAPAADLIEDSPAEPDLVSDLVKPRPIDDDVLQVLRNSRFDGLAFHLPQVQLQRDLYARVANVLKELGGKWKGGKVSAHLFGSEIDRDACQMAIGLGYFTSTKDLGFFPTPAKLVDQMIEWAQIEPGMQTMEPEAGNGAIASALARATGSQELVRCYEILDRNVATLKGLGFTDVHRANFLDVEPTPTIDVVVMNPPFSQYQDVAHVLHAARFLKPDGVLVACTSRSWMNNSHRAADDFRAFVDQSCGVTQEIPAGTFKESGTNVATAVITIEAQYLPWNNRPRERNAA